MNKRYLLLGIILMFCIVSTSAFATHLTISQIAPENMTNSSGIYDGQPPYPALAFSQVSGGYMWVGDIPAGIERNVSFFNFSGITDNITNVININFNKTSMSTPANAFHSYLFIQCWDGAAWTSLLISDLFDQPNNTILNATLSPECIINDNFGKLPLRFLLGQNGKDTGNITFYDVFLNYTGLPTMSTPVANISTGYSSNPFHFNSTLTNSIGATVYNITGIFNNTSYTPTNLGSGVYQTTTTLPSTPGYYEFYYTYNVFYDGTYYFLNSTRSGVTALSLNLTDCSGTGLPIYRFDIFDEEEPLDELLGTFDATFRLWASDLSTYATFNFTYPSNHSHFICIQPNTSTAIISADITYDNTTAYVPRFHFIRLTRVTNATQTIDLFLLNTTYAENILITVKNTRGIRLADVIVKAQRYYEGENVFRYVDMGLTDSNGETNLKLRGNDVYHVFSVWRDNTLLQMFERMIVTSTEILLQIVEGDVIHYWDQFDNIAVSCTENNATFTILCSYSVIDGTSQTFRLVVDEIQTTLVENICDEQQTGSSGTILCVVGDWTDLRIKYTFSLVASRVNLVEGWIGGGFETNFGSFGLFYMVLLLVGALGLSLTLGTPGASVMTIIMLLLGVTLGFLTISDVAITSIIIVLIIIAVKFR